jgi:hypothetical protein
MHVTHLRNRHVTTGEKSMTDSTDRIMSDNSGLADELTAEEQALFSGGETSEEPAVEAEAPAEEAAAPAAPETNVETQESDDSDLADDDVMEDANRGRFIRHGAFHRERKLRQAAEKQLAEYNERLSREAADRARIDERLRIMTQAMEAPQPGQPGQPGQEQTQVPNPDEDPFAYMRYLEGRIEQLNGNFGQVEQQFTAQQEYAQLKTAFVSDAQQYQTKQPDFLKAYTHLMQARDRELMRLGRQDPQERARIVQQEEQMIVSECLRQGRSPSELIYELAKDRGYAVAAPAPAAAPAAAPKPSAVAQVAAIKRGQESAKSLGSAAGGATQPLTADVLANMSEDEFDQVVSKMSRAERAQYFGG